MMKFLLLLISFNFIIIMFNRYIYQMFYQNLIFFMYFIYLIDYPLNNINFWMKVYYLMGVDFYSMGLILLSFWILSMMIMISEKNLFNLNYLIYMFIMNIMLLLLIMCFMSMNLMMFYIFFESSLIPIFMLIMGWGLQIDRIQAGVYMMLYTLFGSLPLFLLIMMIYTYEDSLFMNLVNMKVFNLGVYLMMLLAFLIKMPMYFVHLWLPKAHVEAPLSGSMILAGVMLKLGSYGLLRFMLLMMNVSLKFNKFMIIMSLMGGVYSSLICLCQVDMKMLVAYSSVVHMSILMSGMMTMFNWGYSGGLMMMIAHGLCSSGLFCLVNILYERFKSRSLLISKGLIKIFPSLSLIWFMMCSSNLSFPPSMNLYSEIMLLNSLIMWSLNLIYILMVLLFFSALYSLYLYSYTQHGGGSNLIFNMKSILIMEYMNLILHWIPLNLFFIYMYMFI